uniref:Putative ovule protein n=1 Tax=Solanum chacoense TaxID=4108 RepID=A0A0V0GRJ5_SOLCH
MPNISLESAKGVHGWNITLEGYCMIGSWKELLNFSRPWNHSKGSKTLKIHLYGSPLVKELIL